MSKNKKKTGLTPLKFIILLTVATIIISTVLSLLGIQTTNTTIIPEISELETSVVTVNSMFSLDGLKYIISNALANFIGFAPLGTLLIALMGIGVMEQSGLMGTLCTLIGKKIPKRLLTFMIVFVSIVATVVVDSAYVFLIPISAFLFLFNGRNPITGVTASFAAIAMGHGMNFVFSSFEPTLNSISTIAASLVDSNYILNIWGSFIFMLVATILLSIVITEVTERIVVAKIGKYQVEEKEEIVIEKKEIRGLIICGLIGLGFLLIILYGIMPLKIPGAGFLLDMTKYNYVHKLFGAASPFMKGFTVLLSTMMIIMGVVFARISKKENKLHAVIEKAIADISYGLILIFFTAQFIAIFKQSNLGVFAVNFMVDSLKNVQLTGLPLVLIFLVIAMLANLFMTSPFSKWVIMSPIMVPMFMRAGMTPEFAQIIFRAGASVTSVLTPLLAFLVIYIIFVQKYSKEPVTVGKIYSLLLPYSLFTTVLWLIMILGWYIIGIPVGINIFPLLK